MIKLLFAKINVSPTQILKGDWYGLCPVIHVKFSALTG